jgi:hypothetical protein
MTHNDEADERPKADERIEVRVPRSVKDRAQRYARAHGVSVASLVVRHLERLPVDGNDDGRQAETIGDCMDRIITDMAGSEPAIRPTGGTQCARLN